MLRKGGVQGYGIGEDFKCLQSVHKFNHSCLFHSLKTRHLKLRATFHSVKTLFVETLRVRNNAFLGSLLDMCLFKAGKKRCDTKYWRNSSRQISLALLLLFIPVITKNKITHDGSATTLRPGGYAENLLVPLSWECQEIKEEKWKEW